jgi:hypothetical protein
MHPISGAIAPRSLVVVLDCLTSAQSSRKAAEASLPSGSESFLLRAPTGKCAFPACSLTLLGKEGAHARMCIAPNLWLIKGTRRRVRCSTRVIAKQLCAELPPSPTFDRRVALETTYSTFFKDAAFNNQKVRRTCTFSVKEASPLAAFCKKLNLFLRLARCPERSAYQGKRDVLFVDR